MPLRVAAARSVPAAADLVATLVSAEVLASGLDAADRAAADAQGFEANVGSTTLVARQGRLGLLVGVGGTDTTPADLRKAGAAMARAARRVKHAAVDASSLDDPEAGAFVEGVLLGAYAYDDLKSDPKPVALTKVSIVGPGKRIIDRAAAISDAVNWGSRSGEPPGWVADSGGLRRRGRGARGPQRPEVQGHESCRNRAGQAGRAARGEPGVVP